MSSMQNTVSVDDDVRKPETFTFYNGTKFSVDIFDQMARKNSITAAWHNCQIFYIVSWTLQQLIVTFYTLMLQNSN